MLQEVELKVIKIKNNSMTKRRKIVEPIDEVCDLMKKSLILSLFDMNLSQVEISKKLHMDLNAVNEFLKGLKKK